MADKALEVARARKLEITQRLSILKTEVAVLENELIEINQFIGMWHKLLGASQAEEQTDESIDSPGKNPRKEQIGDLARQLIVERKRPIPRKELMLELDRAGLHIYGAEPEKVVSTMMWRMRDHFVNLKGFGYWLSTEPYGPAKYIPGRSDGLEPTSIDDLI